MKKAFTLIELLVVIAIIAILAAILFPVFAQAKVAAKKAVSISNQKQIGLGIIMYSGDWDDQYPREDNCTLNDSLNTAFNNQPAGTDPSPWCNGSKGYAFRDNHYSWQKWIMPYVKNVSLYFHPIIQKDPTEFNNNGEIFGGYAINLGITGATNTWGSAAANPAFWNSVLGGSQTNLSTPANTMILMELASTAEPAVSTLDYGSYPNKQSYTLAIQEHWAAYFYTQQAGSSALCGNSTQIDPTTVPFGTVVPLSYADGHTAALPVGQFLAETPTAAQLGEPTSSSFCYLQSMHFSVPNKPTWTQSWPLWGMN